MNQRNEEGISMYEEYVHLLFGSFQTPLNPKEVSVARIV